MGVCRGREEGWKVEDRREGSKWGKEERRKGEEEDIRSK